MGQLAARLHALDSRIAQGQILETLEPFFSDDCVFTEVADGSSRSGRQAQHEHLSGFFATLQGFRGATLRSSAFDGDTSLSEWTFDMIAADGSPIVWNEVLVRTWREGMVVSEKYYNAGA